MPTLPVSLHQFFDVFGQDLCVTVMQQLANCDPVVSVIAWLGSVNIRDQHCPAIMQHNWRQASEDLLVIWSVTGFPVATARFTDPGCNACRIGRTGGCHCDASSAQHCQHRTHHSLHHPPAQH